MWWMALIDKMKSGAEERKRREQQDTEQRQAQQPTQFDTAGLNSSVNESAAFDGDVGRDESDDAARRSARRERWGNFGKSALRSYLGGE